MVFLLNALFAILAFFVVRWLAGQVSAPAPVGVLLGIIAAIVVYLANLASQVV